MVVEPASGGPAWVATPRGYGKRCFHCGMVVPAEGGLFRESNAYLISTVTVAFWGFWDLRLQPLWEKEWSVAPKPHQNVVADTIVRKQRRLRFLLAGGKTVSFHPAVVHQEGHFITSPTNKK